MTFKKYKNDLISTDADTQLYYTLYGSKQT